METQTNIGTRQQSTSVVEQNVKWSEAGAQYSGICK